jgi:hypothetical protein
LSHLHFAILMVVCMLDNSGFAFAQAPSTTAVVPAAPSLEILKQARQAGYQLRRVRGTIVFCKEEVHVGTRFSTFSCIDQVQLEEFLIRAHDQHDKLQNRHGTGTDSR